jgi:predicted aspartyl protease
VLLLLSTAFAACDIGGPARVQAPADSASGEVSFEMANANEAAILIPVQVNGGPPVNFVLDTGATLTCIDAALARELGLRDEKGVGGIALGAVRAGRMETVSIDTLRVGNAAVYDLLACKLDLAHLRAAFGASGLLGLNFLKSFDVSIDFDRDVLRLQRTD